MMGAGGIKIDVALNNKTDIRISKKFLREIFVQTIETLGLSADLLRHDFEVSVALVGDEEITDLNAKYRKKNVPTDVLSFAEYSSLQEMFQGQDSHIFLGELIVSPEYVRESAVANNVTFAYEIPYILSHGLLHLFAMEHGAEMFGIQDRVAQKLQDTIFAESAARHSLVKK